MTKNQVHNYLHDNHESFCFKHGQSISDEVEKILLDFSKIKKYKKSPEIAKAEKELAKLIADEYEETVKYAFAHGWRSSRHEKGNELRKIINP